MILLVFRGPRFRRTVLCERAFLLQGSESGGFLYTFLDKDVAAFGLDGDHFSGKSVEEAVGGLVEPARTQKELAGLRSGSHCCHTFV